MSTNEDCKYLFSLVQVNIPQPVKLVLLQAKTKGAKTKGPGPPTLVCHRQLYDLLVTRSTCSFQTFDANTRAKRNTKYHSTKVGGPDLQVLRKLEAVGAQSPAVVAISCSLALQAMKECKVPPAPLAAMRAIKQGSISMTKLPIPEHVFAPNHFLKPSTPKVTVSGPFPKTLPAFQPPANLQQSYGLVKTRPDLVQREPLNSQLIQLQTWCQVPFEFTRNGPPLQLSTWQGHYSNISLFLGHCLHHQEVSEPSLLEYLHLPHICSFLSLKMFQKHSPKTIQALMATTQLVLK